MGLFLRSRRFPLSSAFEGLRGGLGRLFALFAVVVRIPYGIEIVQGEYLVPYCRGVLFSSRRAVRSVSFTDCVLFVLLVGTNRPPGWRGAVVLLVGFGCPPRLWSATDCHGLCSLRSSVRRCLVRLLRERAAACGRMLHLSLYGHPVIRSTRWYGCLFFSARPVFASGRGHFLRTAFSLVRRWRCPPCCSASTLLFGGLPPYGMGLESVLSLSLWVGSGGELLVLMGWGGAWHLVAGWSTACGSLLSGRGSECCLSGCVFAVFVLFVNSDFA